MTSYSWCCQYLAHIHPTLNCVPEDFQPQVSTAMFLRPIFSWNHAKFCCFLVLSFKCWELTSSGSSSQQWLWSGAVLVPQDSYSSCGIILQGIFYRTSQSFSVRLSQCIHCFNRIFFIECSHCLISFPYFLSGIVCIS